MPDTQDDIDNIRPVSQRFFSAVSKDAGLSLTAKESLVNDALEGRVRIEQVRSQLTASRQRERLADLRIEREEYLLSEARRKTQEDKDALAQGAALSGTLSSLLDDETLSPEDKRATMARFRIQNPDAFARNPGLRDQYATLDSLIPAPAKPLTVSEQIALDNFRIKLDDRQRDEFDALEKERKDGVSASLRALDDGFDRVSGAKFKKPEGSLLDDAEFLDEFADPTDRETAIGFITQYGRYASVEASEESLAQLGATELKRLAGEINRKLRPQLLKDLGAASPGSSVNGRLGIPNKLP